MVILEKRFEDWICMNIESVVSPVARCLSRQLRLPNGGVLDVLAIHEELDDEDDLTSVFTIIEVKRDVIDGPAILQLLDYMGVFKECGEAGWIHHQIRLPEADHHRHTTKLRGIVAAPDITPEAAVVVNGLMNVVKYVRLNVEISAERFPTLPLYSLDEDRISDLAAQLGGEIRWSWEEGNSWRDMRIGSRLREANKTLVEP